MKRYNRQLILIVAVTVLLTLAQSGQCQQAISKTQMSDKQVALLEQAKRYKLRFAASLLKLSAKEQESVLRTLAACELLSLKEKQEAVQVTLKQVNLCFRKAGTVASADHSTDKFSAAHEHLLKGILNVLEANQFLVSELTLRELMEMLSSACPLALSQKVLQIVRQNSSIYSIHSMKFNGSAPDSVLARVFFRFVPSRDSLSVRLRKGDVADVSLALGRIERIVKREKKLDGPASHALVHLARKETTNTETKAICIVLLLDAGELAKAEKLLGELDEALRAEPDTDAEKLAKLMRMRLNLMKRAKPKSAKLKETQK